MSMEALGAVGSVVGIVSLSMQISQGLLTYYRSWANQNPTVANICRLLENLSKTVQIISLLAKKPIFRKSTIENIQAHVKHVEDALDELARKLDEVRGVKVSDKGEPATKPQESKVQDKGSQSRIRAPIKLSHSPRGKASKSIKPHNPGATVKGHLSYPFEEETLKDIQNTVSEACNSLNRTLHILQA
jgi:hypothetical protein